MGAIYRKQFTKSVPDGAEIITLTDQVLAKWVRCNGTKMHKLALARGEMTSKQFARWNDRHDKVQTEPLVEGRNDRISVTARTYTAGYRDGSGHFREVATGCKDLTAAKQVLAGLEKRADAVRSGLRTATDDAMVNHKATDLQKHFDAYMIHLEADGTTAEHRENVKRCFDRLKAECRFSKLSDFRRESLEAWLVAREKEGMGARTRNIHRACLVAFANWCNETDRLSVNPFTKVSKADEESDKRRKRRSLTEKELTKLLEVARERPLIEAHTIRRGKRRGQLEAKVSECVRERLERLGHERALMYKTMVLTGLRMGELASLTVGQVDLDGQMPFIILEAADEKNGEGSDIPLRGDLAHDLRTWLAEKSQVVQDSARQTGGPIPICLAPDAKLFTVPAGLIRILDRDLKMAGIPNSTVGRRIAACKYFWY